MVGIVMSLFGMVHHVASVKQASRVLDLNGTKRL